MRMTRRSAMAAAVIVGLALTGCTEGSDGSQTSSGRPQAKAHLVLEDPDAYLSGTAVGDGSRSSIIVPTGTVSMAPVQRVETIPGALVGKPGTLLPASGEVFTVVTLSYTAAEVKQRADGALVPDVDLETPVITLERGEDTVELTAPSDGESLSLLISAPKDQGAIVVTQAGHAQQFSLTDGQRIPDAVARTYYRPKQGVIEVGQRLSPPKEQIEVENAGGNTSTVSVTVDGDWTASNSRRGRRERAGRRRAMPGCACAATSRARWIQASSPAPRSWPRSPLPWMRRPRHWTSGFPPR